MHSRLPRLSLALPALAVTLLAQTPQADPWMQVHGAGLDANHDGVLTQTELFADATRGFTTYDREGDGIITSAELAATGDVRAGSEFAGMIFRHFSDLDLDGDRNVARKEFDEAVLYFFNTADRDRDGVVAEAEWKTSPNAPLPIPPAARTSAATVATPTTPSSATGSARLVNLATRVSVGGSAGVPISGFTVRGGAKRVVVRAIGPALSGFGVAGALPDPSVALVADNVALTGNDNWSGSDAAAFTAVGAFPLTAGSRDAALVANLGAGGYSALLGAGNSAGIALLEIYDADAATSAGALVNVSTRAFVGTGEQQLIPGFVVAGEGSLRVLIRAVGPTLASFGVGGTLADPQIAVFRGAVPVASNDNWSGAEIAAAATSVGAFTLPGGSRDAALLLTLSAGNYTAVVSGAGKTTGVALVELYVLP